MKTSLIFRSTSVLSRWASVFSKRASSKHASWMRRSAWLGLTVVCTAVLVGCPVYSDNSYGRGGCYYATDCPIGQRCMANGYCVPGPSIDGGGTRETSVLDAPVLDAPVLDEQAVDGGTDVPSKVDGAAVVWCANPNDCALGETCSPAGICRSGDCSTNGCVNQFQCAMVTSGPSPLACVHADSQACGADHQCAKSARCVDGRCTSIADLCTDRAQCSPGSACVDGKCVVTCISDSQCPGGSLCRLALEICDAKAKTCSITSDCASQNLVCVDGGCVPRCGAVGTCADGGASACVDNGCISSQKLRSACQADGSTAGCSAGEICVHHACYTSCQAPNAAACAALSATPVCKNVIVGTTMYAVCGSAQTLGSECDPTADKGCAADKTCVDGFCK